MLKTGIYAPERQSRDAANRPWAVYSVGSDDSQHRSPVLGSRGLSLQTIPLPTVWC